MLRTASACACRAAFRASSGAHVLSASGVPGSAAAAAIAPISSMAVLLRSTTGHSTYSPSTCKRAMEAYRQHSGVAQGTAAAPESNLQDRHLDQDASTDPAKTYDQGHIAPHKGLSHQGSPDPQQQKADAKYWLMQPVYTHEYAESVKPRHIPATQARQKAASTAVYVARSLFDRATGYNLDSMNEQKWLRRFLFLETVAGVPGMVGGMLRHMKSLRSMRRDNGWIHTLLEEAENERMHLLTFLQLRQPGLLFRGMVLLSQGIFFNAYFLAYLVSPKSCHAFVGYLEEEAVKTYTHAIADLDAGRLPAWSHKKAPEIARDYWKLGENATMRDLLLSVRADEACHSHVNHTFSQMQSDGRNPFVVGTHLVPTA